MKRIYLFLGKKMNCAPRMHTSRSRKILYIHPLKYVFSGGGAALLRTYCDGGALWEMCNWINTRMNLGRKYLRCYWSTFEYYKLKSSQLSSQSFTSNSTRAEGSRNRLLHLLNSCNERNSWRGRIYDLTELWCAPRRPSVQIYCMEEGYQRRRDREGIRGWRKAKRMTFEWLNVDSCMPQH